MRRRRSLFRFAFVVAAGLTLALVLAYAFLLPWVVHRKIASALDSMGLTPVRFDVHRVTPWTLELRDVQAGDVTPDRISAIVVDYSPAVLRSGRIHTVRLTGVDVTLDLRKGRIDTGPWADGKFSTKPKALAALDLPFDRLELESSSLTLTLARQTIRLPAKGYLVRQGDARFRVELALTVDHKQLNLSGTIGPASSDIDLAAGGEGLSAADITAITSAFWPGVHLTAEGSLNGSARGHWSGGRGEATLIVQPNALSLNIIGRGGKPSRVQGISGRFQMQMSHDPGSAVHAKLTMQGASLDGTSWGCAAKAIRGEVTYDDLLKLTTNAGQSIGVGKLTIGKMEFADGSVIFRMNNAHAINIQRTQWTWLGGTVSAENFGLDSLHPKLDATVQIAEVDLRQLLIFFAPTTASGDGTITGRFPVVVDWPDIHFGDGSLLAAPGGSVQVKDMKAIAAALDQTGQSGSTEVRRRVLEALGDFQFDVLRAALRNDSQGLGADLHLNGKGRTGSRTPLDIEIRIHGLDDLLKLYLGYQHSASSSAEAINVDRV
jgi:hypothetical protein